MARHFDPYIDISPASLSGWAEKDLSANCPGGTSGIIVLCHNTSVDTSYVVGIRKDGSTDDIKDTLRYGSSVVFFIGVSTARRVRIYSESNDVKWWLLGDFKDDAVFFDNAYDHTPTVLSTWQDRTLTEIASGSPGAFWILQGKHLSIGICQKDASWDKDITQPAQIVGAVVGVNGSKVSEAYKTNASQKHYVVGYLVSGEGQCEPDTLSGYDFQSYYNEWRVFDKSAQADYPTRTLFAVNRVYDTAASLHKVDAKPYPSSESHYATPYDQRWLVSNAPGGRQMVLKKESTNIEIWLTAFFLKPELDEDVQVIGTGVISTFDTWEVGDVSIEALIGYDIQPELGDVLGVGVVSSLDWQTYMENSVVTAKANIRSIAAEPSTPSVKGTNPAPNETSVLRNKKVGFYIAGATLDEVDIDTVHVKINGVDYQKGDPEFFYSGYGELYWIEVDHPLWGYESIITIVIDAVSMLNQAMPTKTYSFLTEWEGGLTRSGTPKIELYEAGEYSLSILTMQEDWVRQGTPRISPLYELWYGRYMILPYVENIEMRVISGATNSLGKEVIDNGWLSVSINEGAYVAIGPSTVLSLGPMYSHEKKSIRFKLSIPDGANTVKYMLLRFEFTPKCFRGYGSFAYDTGIYLSDGELVNFDPNLIIYRAYVFNNEMWNQLIISGIVTSPFYRGEDKQW